MTTEINSFAIIFILLNGLYFFLLFLVFTGLSRLSAGHAGQDSPSVSIIISARDEERRIIPCLESLEKIIYPANKHEVILVNDCSSDSTGDIIWDFSDRHENWHALHLQEKSHKLRGKSNALREGVSKSSGELIFVTDADCIVPPGWVRRTVSFFGPDVTMVLGHSPLVAGHGFFQRFQEFDNLFSAIVAASSTKMGYAFNSIGRNLAYRSRALEEIGGYDSLERFHSGDDIHLTDRFRSVGSGIIEYCADQETFVLTQATKNGREFLNQQIRKNSKTFLRSPMSMLLPFGLLAYHFILVLFPFLFHHLFFLWLAFLCCKFMFEFICLYKATAVYHQRQLNRYLPLMQIIYPGYIIIMTILGGLQLYRWK